MPLTRTRRVRRPADLGTPESSAAFAYLVLRSPSERRADDAQKRAPGGLRLEGNEPLA
jgi:hypothetical protein